MSAVNAHPVLVVEDDALLQMLFSKVLELGGFEVVVAADGEAALAMLAERPFSLVILDGNLPRLRGAEVVRRMRSHPATAKIPAIMVSGSADAANRVEGMQAGANDYLVKPVDVEELVARAKAQLRSGIGWEAAMASSWEERKALAPALAGCGRCDTPTEAARAVCEAVVSLGGITHAAVYHWPRLGLVIPLAEAGTQVRSAIPGRPLATSLAAQLEGRLADGALVSTRRGDGGGQDVVVALGPHAAPFGILRVDARPQAAAVLGGELALATVADAAAMAAAVLEPMLASAGLLAAGAERLRRALGEGRLGIGFQPVMDLVTREVVGHEALVRAADGTPAEALLAQAASGGASEEIEASLAQRAVSFASEMGLEGWISINLSPPLARSSSLVSDLVGNCPIPVVVELSDKAAPEDLGELGSALRSAGAQVALDNVGVGYSSLRHIEQLSPDLVKLDRDWIWGLEGDAARRAMVGAAASFAAARGCEVVAVGIETEAELEALGAMGVPLGQGHLLGRERRPKGLAGEH